MKREKISYIYLLDERTLGKKLFYLRYEIPEKGGDYYCVRDSKFNKIFETYSRKSLEKHWDVFVSLLQSPNNPYHIDDIIYEHIPATKDTTDIYSFYQVIQSGTKNILVRPVETRTDIEFWGSELIPLKNHFVGEEILKLKVEIIQDKLSSTLEYGIKSKNGQWKKLKFESVSIPKQYNN